jgi:hypothetical protein
MFLAIINDTYSEVKAEVNARKEAFQVSLIYSVLKAFYSI